MRDRAIAALALDPARLLDRLNALAEIGALDGGGCTRLALSDEDRRGRDLVTTWMHDLDMSVSIDTIGNIVATWAVGEGPPVMMGSHIDTVRAGGRYDGNYGVLAGLEIVEALQRAGASPSRPVSVAAFTNEEGARFQPDMLGSLVYVGGLAVEEALDHRSIDGARLGDELAHIGYAGTSPSPGLVPHAYVELHIEQGPILEAEGFQIGAVTGVQGISWHELTIEGQSNHAGTTPMAMRRDAMYAAAQLVVFVRDLAHELGGHQVATVGRVDAHPNLVNVVANRVTMTVDLRNTDEVALREAEAMLRARVVAVATADNVTITSRPLARFEPVDFDPAMVDRVETAAHSLGYKVKRLPSGAGHDAQMLARVCPTAMIFVPSAHGISHNPAEHTDAADLAAGAEVLLHVVAGLA